MKGSQFETENEKDLNFFSFCFQDMIKHTPHDHPDHGSLQLALGEIKTLADRMNRGEKEVDQAEREAERLRDLEATIEGMTEVDFPLCPVREITSCPKVFTGL